MEDCDCKDPEPNDNTEIFWNQGQSFWTVESAKSTKCFEKGIFNLFRDGGFVDRETAIFFLNEEFEFGGRICSPGGQSEIIEPIII